MRTIISTLYVVAATFTMSGVQADDPPPEQIPANFREYFRRIDESIAKSREELPKEIANMEEEVAAELDPKAKTELQTRVAAAKKRLVQVQQPSYEPVVTVTTTQVGSLGKLPVGHIGRIVDNDTMILETKRPRDAGVHYFIITRYPTRTVRGRLNEPLEEDFRITSPQVEIRPGVPHYKLLHGLPLRCLYCVVEPVKPRDLGKYRAMYEAEKQAAVEKADDMCFHRESLPHAWTTRSSSSTRGSAVQTKRDNSSSGLYQRPWSEIQGGSTAVTCCHSVRLLSVYGGRPRYHAFRGRSAGDL